ncbi:ATP-binding protein [Actinophytocola sp.]|uniref:ATP-binding protein n=1 Tax=Actinophytocola sp. TaxID=1872138 RepID=UPI003899999C
MRRRILLAILMAVAVTACALGIPLGFSATAVVESITREELGARVRQIAASVDDQLGRNGRLDMNSLQLGVPTGGHLLVTLPDSGQRDEFGAKLQGETITEELPIVQHGIVRLSISANQMRTTQTQVTLLVFLVVIAAIGGGTAVATVTARRLARPLRHVADRASRLGAGDFRLDRTRYDVPELDSVAEALDASATALAQLVQRERELVGDVSHQLRSRMTSLQLRIEELTVVSDEEVAAEARAALEQAERLAEVLDELMAAAREARSAGAMPVDLAAELPSIADEWRDPLRAEGRSLKVKVEAGLYAKASPGRLREVIGVLLDNALRHGSGTVTLSAREGVVASGGDTVVIEVADMGTGVPDELAEHIFERGVSGGGSTGLGLALARALIDSDGGRLELSVKRPATFTVFLPVPRAGDVQGVRWPAERSPR